MSTDDAYCPHCKALLQADAPHPFPERAMRCSACRLLVGPGRSRGAGGAPRPALEASMAARVAG